ncbi:MAG: hypothetical protein PHF13_02175 [Acholeplasmataceae bacterium]|nr:hypothetical protein [Acholeplasmataceae bacterium]
MYYIPIIKLKKREINKAKYLQSYLSHPNIVPFLELRYSLESTDKNTRVDDFVDSACIKTFFLGIPHKASVISYGTGGNIKEDYLFIANSSASKYLEESKQLFLVDNCIPIYYIYSEEDLNFYKQFVELGHQQGRPVGLLARPNLALRLDNNAIQKNDFLFIDLEGDEILSQKPNLERITFLFSSKIILIRENRNLKTMNTHISLDGEAPLVNDLSTEFDNVLKSKIKLRLFGFADYCGFKNDVSIGSKPIDSSNFYPAIALYQKQKTPPIFLGIRSSTIKQYGGFLGLATLVKDRFDVLDPKNLTPLNAFINCEKTGDYTAWNVITQWFYIAQMSIFDDWKNFNISNY